MKIAVLLDSAPLGLITNPKANPEALACNRWLRGLLDAGVTVYIPEIVDYEVRRELLRGNKTRGIQRLDDLAQVLPYLPLTTDTMRQAALFWATVRQQGLKTADDKALDGDVILAAQARVLERQAHTTIIATSNVKHLNLFVDARLWSEIRI